ncbi:AAA family ATPase [Rhodococcus hoagii]|nr:AAA family ATPase [Prescottella equi]
MTVLLDGDHPIMACRGEIERRARLRALQDAADAAEKAKRDADAALQAKVAAEHAAAVATAESSWQPIDLTAILADIAAGTVTLPEATIMPRADGLCLLYPGLVHSFHGESESGKSLLMQYACAVEIGDAHDVLYLDYESDQLSVVQRIAQLGAPIELIARHLTYVRPGEALNSAVSRARWAQLLSRRYSFVVLDGVTDALATFGYSSIDNDEVTKWTRDVPKHIADTTGAAVALIDHVSKDNGGRGRFAIGGSAKMNGLTGAAYVVEVEEPLGRGRRGVLAVRIGKDRPGGVRGRLPAGKPRSDRTEPVATVVVDSTAGAGIHVELQVPTELAPSGATRHDAAALTRAAEHVSAHPGLSKTATAQSMTGKYAANLAALATLITNGYVVDQGRGKGLHVVKPYEPADDVFAMHTTVDTLPPS